MALVILALGNDLLGDDGIGLLAGRALEGRAGPDVFVRSTAQSGLYLLEHLQGFDDAIVIDTIVGERPGRVRELTVPEVSPVAVPSAHYAGLPEALAIAEASGLSVPRRLRIFAIEIAAAQAIGSPPRPEVLGALPDLLARVEAAAKEWGYCLGAAEERVAPCTSTA